MKYYLVFLLVTTFSLGTLSMEGGREGCKCRKIYKIITPGFVPKNVNYLDFSAPINDSIIFKWDNLALVSVKKYMPVHCHLKEYIEELHNTIDKVNSEREVTLLGENDLGEEILIVEKSPGLISEKKIFFIDFHGVLQSAILVGPNGEKYKHVPNIINIIFRPDVKTAIQRYRHELEYVYDKIKQCDWIETSNKNQTTTDEDKTQQIVKWVTTFASFFMDKTKEHGFEVQYHPTNDYVQKFMKAEKDKGAEMIVLSGGKWSPQVKAFLDEIYPNIFTNNEMAIELKNLISSDEKLCNLAEDYSYIKSENKSKFLASLAGKKKKYEFFLIDDNLTTIRHAFEMLKKANESSFGEILEHFTLVPYPFLPLQFDAKEFIDEVKYLFNHHFDILAQIMSSQTK